MTINPVAKPKSKLRGRIERGNLSRLAVFMPEPALMTSIMTAASSPDLTPMVTASEVATTAVADNRLFASFMVWAEPGLVPMKNTLPMTSSAGLTAAKSARGPDTITARVPFSAPPTPPLTGLSSWTMSRFASKSWIRTAMCEPTVERSTKRLTRLPSITPPVPVATSSEACSDGRLASTVSALVRDFPCGGRRPCAERDQPVDRLLTLVEYEQAMSRFGQAARHGKAHFAKADETDVHGDAPQPLSISANTSRAIRKLSTPAGTPA